MKTNLVETFRKASLLAVMAVLAANAGSIQTVGAAGNSAVPGATQATVSERPAENQVLILDGESDCVRIPDSPSLHLFTNAITIEVWFKALSFYPNNIDESDLFIGKGDPEFSFGEHFHGAIDEVRIWNVARSPQEIQAAMNTTLAGNEPGLVAYWNFDDGTAKDASPNGNDGLLQAEAKVAVSPRPTALLPDKPETEQTKAEAERLATERYLEVLDALWRSLNDIYIRISRWMGDGLTKEFDQALEEFKDSKGIVIDVRGNGGGNDQLAYQVNGRLIAKPIVSSIDFWRKSGSDLYNRTIGWVQPRGPWPYKGRAVVLIDEGCCSACEHFVSGIEAMGNVLMVGIPTNGAGGGPTTVTLPDGARIRISRALGLRVNGIVFEGHGIPPHIFSTPTLADLRQDRDAALDIAREWILSGKDVPARSQPLVNP